jgi:hypothetical protein
VDHASRKTINASSEYDQISLVFLLTKTRILLWHYTTHSDSGRGIVSAMSAIVPKLARKAPTAVRAAKQAHGLVSVCVTASRASGRVSCRSIIASSSQLSRAFHSTPIHQDHAPASSGPTVLLPEFSLRDRVIVVSGGAQGLGLVQTEALLEAGATGRLSRPRSCSLG